MLEKEASACKQLCWSHTPTLKVSYTFVLDILCLVYCVEFSCCSSYICLVKVFSLTGHIILKGFIHKRHNLVVVDQENRWKFKIVNRDRGGSISHLETLKHKKSKSEIKNKIWKFEIVNYDWGGSISRLETVKHKNQNLKLIIISENLKL